VAVAALKSPNGHEIVVELRSGGIVGSSLDQVEADAAQAAIGVMEDQIRQALERRKAVQVIPAEAFWEYYSKRIKA
jgi:hypothetical protein